MILCLLKKIDEYGDWKVFEFRIFFFYYFVFLLEDVFFLKYFDYFCNLVFGIFLFLKILIL